MSQETTQNKPLLPLNMRYIEGERRYSNNNSSYFYEMEEWVNYVLTLDNDTIDEYFDKMSSIVVDKKYKIDENGIVKQNELPIIIKISTYTDYYLLGPSKDKDKLIKKYQDENTEDLKLLSRRGYPDWLFCGKAKDWRAIELNDRANLSLSTEEVTILNSSQYPFFINGLAGSGKSTILQYLFADSYRYKKLECKDENFKYLYLSYSNELVENSKKNILALLKADENPISEIEEKVFINSFHQFRDFLRSKYFLTSEDSRKYSSDNQFVDYRAFQNWYDSPKNQWAKKNKYSATIIWAVIRSLIKGYRKDDTFDFETIHTDDRIVSRDIFDTICVFYKTYYKNYINSNNYWDEIDLVKCVWDKLCQLKESELWEKQYNVIYCDEAQDFTFVENQLILKLSRYSNYDLRDSRLLPLAFAGDPNQTITPTGFSWQRTKSNLTSYFKDYCVRLSDKQLHNNYRSRWNIVKLANAIMFFKTRTKGLSKEPVAPQKEWVKSSVDIKPCFLIPKDNKQKSIINTIMENVSCIITSDDGEYATDSFEKDLKKQLPEYWNEDQYIGKKASNVLRKLVRTSTSSKGMEYRDAVLYKFVDRFENKDLIKKLFNENETLNESERFELAHFITKLYVAISRPKQILYIVDTEEAYDLFWKYFEQDNKDFIINKLLEKDKYAHNWVNSVGGIYDFNSVPTKPFLSSSKKSFLEQANRNYNDAVKSKNVENMLQVEAWYNLAGEHKQYLCKAYAYSFDKKYSEAGDMFLEYANKYEKKEEKKREQKSLALDAYWTGKIWKLYYLYDSTSDKGIACGFMDKKLSIADLRKSKTFVDSIDSYDHTWNVIVEKIGEISKSEDNINGIIKFLEELIIKDFKFLKKYLPELHFKIENWKEAVDLWTELKNTNHHDYYYASWKIAKDANSIIKYQNELETPDFLEKEGVESILERYYRPKEPVALNESSKRIIFRKLLKEDQYEKALNYEYSGNGRIQELYHNNPLKFVKLFVLKKFSNEKLRYFSEVINDEIELFVDEEMIESILNNFNQTYKLLGRYESIRKYLLKNKDNRTIVIDLIAKGNDNKRYSCLLDLIFCYHYDYDYACKYRPLIIEIIKNYKHTEYLYSFKDLVKEDKYFKGINFSKSNYKLLVEKLLDFLKNTLSERGIDNEENLRLIQQTINKLSEVSIDDESDKKDEYLFIKTNEYHRDSESSTVVSNIDKEEFDNYEVVENEETIDDSNITIIKTARNKRIEFFVGESDDATEVIVKGKLNRDNGNLTDFEIGTDFHVTIISENEVHIRYKNKRYKVTF